MSVKFIILFTTLIPLLYNFAEYVIQNYPLPEVWLKVRYYNAYFYYEFSYYSLPAIMYYYIHRLVTYKKQDQLTWKTYNDLPNSNLDKIFKIAVLYGGFYQIIDLMSIVGSGLIFKDICGFSHLVHHVPSIIMINSCGMAKYLPFWLIGPGMWHHVLLAFPEWQYIT